MQTQRRSPSWGAWIEIHRPITSGFFVAVAPPRGERGLKFHQKYLKVLASLSLPLVGSVD